MRSNPRWRLKQFFLLSLFFLTFWAKAVQYPTPGANSSLGQGSVVSGATATSTMSLYFTITQIPQSVLSTTSIQSGLDYRQVSIVLPNCGGNSPITTNDPTGYTPSPANNSFIWTFAGTQTVTGPDINNNYQITYNIKVEPAAGSTITFASCVQTVQNKSIDPANASQYVGVQLIFNDSANGAYTPETISTAVYQVPVITSKPDELPDNVEATEIFKGATISWSGNVPVSYTDSSQQTPANVLLMLFDPDNQPYTLSANRCTSEACKTSKKVSCTFNYTSPDNACIQCINDKGQEDDFTFLDSTQNLPSSQVSFQTISNAATDGSYPFTGLDVGKQYYLVAAYDQGVKRTDCLSVVPIQTYSLAEANGEAQATPGDPRCFIVSATYGDVHHPHVMLFRWFRDTFILKTRLGQDFVAWYYEQSPPLANAIATHPTLQLVTLTLLWIPTTLLYLIKAIWLYPQASSLFLFCLLAFLLFFRANIKRGGRRSSV